MNMIGMRIPGAILSLILAVSVFLAGCGPAAATIPPTGTVAVSPLQATQTAEAAPQISDFAACPSTCTGANAQTTFPANTDTVYITWKYTNFPKGAHYVRTWTLAGKGVWKTYDCAWDRPESGQIDIKFFDLAGGLGSGDWTLKMTVNDQVVLEQHLTIQGTNNHWDPQPPISSCFS